MSDSEKWGWFTIAAVAMTIAAYGVFFAFIGHVPAITSVFALLALSALPSSARRHFRGRSLDEREREIANRAVRAGFSALWVAFIGFVLAIGFVRGWDTTVTAPVWTLTETLWWAAVLILGVQAVVTVTLYRRGADA